MARRIVALAALALLALAAVVATASASATEGPYEDIQSLLRSAASSSRSLAALDPRRSPPRVVEVHHEHHHVVPHDMPRRVAQRIAEDSTPPPTPIRVLPIKNRVQAARERAEDAAYDRAARKPSITTVDVKQSFSVRRARPRTYTIRGQRGETSDEKKWEVSGSGFHMPLVDRGLKRATFSVVAEIDGQDAAGNGTVAADAVKPHTAKELQEEAARLLERAKLLQAKQKEEEASKLRESLGVFDARDVGYEDEMTRLKRVSARMNRLLEQIETPRPDDSFEGHIARQKYYLKLYRALKKETTEIVESYALRTGKSIFSMFGDKPLDPSIAAFLPPNSVAGILAHYANPTRSRDDETPRDVVSGKDAKRIKYAIDYYWAKRNATLAPLPPTYAPTDAELKEAARQNDPRLNKVVATQLGDFGQGRPAVTTGTQAVGRSSVHISVVNPTETQHARGLPYQVNLKRARPTPSSFSHHHRDKHRFAAAEGEEAGAVGKAPAANTPQAEGATPPPPQF